MTDHDRVLRSIHDAVEVVQEAVADFEAEVRIISPAHLLMESPDRIGCPLEIEMSEVGDAWQIGAAAGGGWDDPVVVADVISLVQECLAGCTETLRWRHDRIVASKVRFADGSTYSWSRRFGYPFRWTERKVIVYEPYRRRAVTSSPGESGGLAR